MANEILWTPDSRTVDNAQVTRFQRWLAETRGLEFEDYAALWQWSVDELEAFWRAIWEYYELGPDSAAETVLADASMPGAKWFPEARVNYAAQVFSNATEERPAIVFQGETTAVQTIGWAELEARVAACAHHLKQLGVEPGDRIASGRTRARTGTSR